MQARMQGNVQGGGCNLAGACPPPGPIANTPVLPWPGPHALHLMLQGGGVLQAALPGSRRALPIFHLHGNTQASTQPGSA